MSIEERIKHSDPELYINLKKLISKDIKLGDKPENLMRHDSHKRIGRRLKQTRWGT